MTKKEQYENKTEELVLPILSSLNFELYDIEYVKDGGDYCLRVFIDKEEGITLNDCESVSRKLSDLLDKYDFIPDSYILEVSSPGLGRHLKKDKHFKKSIGEEIEIKLFKPINKCKEFVGILLSFDENIIRIEQEENKILEFYRKDIAMVRLTIDFW